MAKQKLWRASVTVIEQENGYYTVGSYERWEHGGELATVLYPNLTWSEVQDCVGAVVEIMEETRRKEHVMTLRDYGVQGSIFE